MANRYGNLIGTNKIRDEYPKINQAFDEVQQEVDALDERIEITEEYITTNDARSLTIEQNVALVQRDIDKAEADIEVLDGKLDTIDADINARVDNIITTPIEGTVAAQEVVDARGGSVSLGARLTGVDSQLAQNTSQFNSTINQESAQLGAELVDAAGWTSAGWTGDFTNGFTHTLGQTTPLTKNIGATGTKIYLVRFHVSSPTKKWNLTVTIGNSNPFEIYVGDNQEIDYSIAIQSVSDGALSFNPEETFDGTITNISVKEVISGYEATTIIKDSDGANSIEIRNNKTASDNLFIGKNSGSKHVDGYGNVGVGVDALKNNVTGFWNNALGHNALENNVGGSRNVAIGFNALVANVSGQRNQAIGCWALSRNTTGIKNIAIGSDTMFFNTSGYNNIGIGFAALQLQTEGYNNIALGSNAMNNNLTGNDNVALGRDALYRNESGKMNVAIGATAGYGYENSNASYNVFIGYGAGTRVSNGSNFNVSIGLSAGYNQRTGSSNVAIGRNAGFGMTGASFSKNTLIGESAGAVLNTGGDNNVLIGFEAGKGITTGANNIIIGANKDTPTPTTNNYLNIGGELFAHMVALKFGLGVADPKARLHIEATTASIPSIIIEQGAVPTNPDSDLHGAVYYDGADLYFTNHAGLRRKIAFVA